MLRAKSTEPRAKCQGSRARSSKEPRSKEAVPEQGEKPGAKRRVETRHSAEQARVEDLEETR